MRKLDLRWAAAQVQAHHGTGPFQLRKQYLRWAATHVQTHHGRGLLQLRMQKLKAKRSDKVLSKADLPAARYVKVMLSSVLALQTEVHCVGSGCHPSVHLQQEKQQRRQWRRQQLQ